VRSLRLSLLTLRGLFTDTPIKRAAVIAIVLVPLLYGALYLWAFWDPYGKLDRLPIALVNLDRPATADGETVNAGSDLAAKLLEDGAVDWSLVSAEEAAAGLHDQRYYLSLTIPRDFSASLASANGQAPVRAELHVVAQESSNMLASQIMSRVFAEVRSAAAASTSKRYLDKMFVGFSDAHDGLIDAALGARDLREGIVQADDGARKLAEGAGTADDGAHELAKGLDRLADGATRTATGSASLALGTHTLVQGLGDARDAASRVADGASHVATGSAQLSAAIARLAAGSSELDASSSELAAGAARLSAGIGEANDAIGEAASHAGDLHSGAGELATALHAYAKAHPEAESDAAFAEALGRADAVVDGSEDLAEALGGANNSAAALREGARRLAAGTSQLAEGARSLSAGITLAESGSAKLTAGAGALSAGTAQLSSGVGAAEAGAGKLVSGSAELAAGTGKVASGSMGAATGAATLADGTSRLGSGARALARGLQPAIDGAEELRSGLASGANDVPDYSAAKRRSNAEMMSDPVSLATTKRGEVPTYGTGFTPYFVPLALWVGALLAFFILKPLPDRAIASGANPLVCALASYLPGAVLGVAQAVILLAVVQLGLGLRPVNSPATYAFAIATSLVFVAILQALNGAFGAVGKLISIVMLMLQLTSAGGTFPTQLIPGFFQAIHPLLPMSYVVAGLRQTISGGDLLAATGDAGALLVFGTIALSVTTAAAWRRQTFTMERLHPSLTL
jgi:putative membrane protein